MGLGRGGCGEKKGGGGGGGGRDSGNGEQNIMSVNSWLESKSVKTDAPDMSVKYSVYCSVN